MLYYCAHFGTILAAPVVTVFGLLGLARLSARQVKQKALTLAICAAASLLPVALLCVLYFRHAL